MVTHDRDFGRLAIAQREAYHGLLYLRPGHMDAAATIALLRAVFASDVEVTPPFLLIAERAGGAVKMRLRQ